MCLSIPGKVIKIEVDFAEVSVGGTIVKVGTQMVDDVKVGDYVLVHAGFALQKIDEKEALETLQLFREMSDD
ncbi:MAG: HypC/HybG/HupF family hydrogenase formation chaperone [Bacteroidales bacterium]|jgi:hydrogenase expression/formation protein HypC|nr:HypC/HybG/HupF family hydrogenase formation chaperone [Bacteroidales bacterium]